VRAFLLEYFFDKITVIRKSMRTKIIATNKDHLRYLIQNEVEINGNQCDLNHIDVSNIVDMKQCFYGIDFKGDISKWDVSKVKDMCGMFECANFNGDISQWDVSSVENIFSMFYNAEFSGDLSNWKPYALTNLIYAFDKCSAPIPYWANFENIADRVIALKTYYLNKELKENLTTNPVLIKKQKI
jgi:hypothetical protein